MLGTKPGTRERDTSGFRHALSARMPQTSDDPTAPAGPKDATRYAVDTKTGEVMTHAELSSRSETDAAMQRVVEAEAAKVAMEVLSERTGGGESGEVEDAEAEGHLPDVLKDTTSPAEVRRRQESASRHKGSFHAHL